MYTVDRSSHTETFPLYFGSQKTFQDSGGCAKDSCVVDDRVRSPHEWHSIHLSVRPHQRQGSELRRELLVAGNLCEVERRRQSGRRDRRRHIARRRNHVVVSGAASAQFGHQFVARSHVGGRDLAVILLFESFNERGIGIAFPHQQVECGRLLRAAKQQPRSTGQPSAAKQPPIQLPPQQFMRSAPKKWAEY